jgi:hypothetical protein
MAASQEGLSSMEFVIIKMQSLSKLSISVPELGF